MDSNEIGRDSKWELNMYWSISIFFISIVFSQEEQLSNSFSYDISSTNSIGSSLRRLN